MEEEGRQRSANVTTYGMAESQCLWGLRQSVRLRPPSVQTTCSLSYWCTVVCTLVRLGREALLFYLGKHWLSRRFHSGFDYLHSTTDHLPLPFAHLFASSSTLCLCRVSVPILYFSECSDCI
uniref:Uncharacterized protein n=1 Tax=Salmo trutta TaxID=8032 RepID=A0A673Z738_SALTR